MTKRVREVLSKLPHIEEKKMFGGIAFMVNDKMCATVKDNHIMCRIDPLIHDDVVHNPGVSTVRMKGRNYVGGIYVEKSIMPNKKQLRHWIDFALEYNTVAK